MTENLSGYEQYRHPPNLMFEVMARRSALITGDSRLDPFRAEPVRSMYLNIPPQPEPRIAELVIDREAADAQHPLETQVLTLGLFHANDQQWRFFPELVRLYEIEDVSWGIEGLDQSRDVVLKDAAAAGRPAIDYAHPATKAARGDMHGLLAAGDVGKAIISRASGHTGDSPGPAGSVVIDEATEMYLASYFRFIDADAETRLGRMHISSLVRVLEARFRGLQFFKTAGNVIRGFANIRIAVAEADNPDRRTPAAPVVDEGLWSRLSTAPDILAAYERDVSGFTADACAVAANWDTPL